jgi:hypothetical protein
LATHPKSPETGHTQTPKKKKKKKKKMRGWDPG